MRKVWKTWMCSGFSRFFSGGLLAVFALAFMVSGLAQAAPVPDDVEYGDDRIFGLAQTAPVPTDAEYSDDSFTEIAAILRKTAGLRARVLDLCERLLEKERLTPEKTRELQREARDLCREVTEYIEVNRVSNRGRLVQISQARLNAAYQKLCELLVRKRNTPKPPPGIMLITDAAAAPSMFPPDPHPRPITIMIENHSRARPQSGLDRADIVYEMLVEGGITRFMSVYFQEDDAKVIGPVRSCRDYFLDRSLEYDAIYVHCGSSPAGLQKIKLLQVDHLDEMMCRKVFWRDKKRQAPHNLYTSLRRIRDEIKCRSFRNDTTWGSTGYTRKKSVIPGVKKLLFNPNRISTVAINYHPRYIVSYSLSPLTGRFLRFINGKPHKDAVTGKQLATPNIIIQMVDNKVVDKEGRLNIQFSGEGVATYVLGGSVIGGAWKKLNPVSSTTFLDQDGKTVKFLDGPIWIQVVPGRAKVVLGDEPPGRMMTSLVSLEGRL